MANNRERQPVEREIPPPASGAGSPGAERQRRQPWTAPRLKTLDARAAPPGPSITDGVNWYIPIG